ncbi:MAG TPA: thiamine-phosphate kinase [Spirochaetia bacterium]|nr:thiamine-phosphate kinase [Spirochaetia bacterium]
MKIDELGEFGLIDRIRAALPPHGPGVLTGIGDDVAVLQAGGRGGGATDTVWLATCDVLVEGSHFIRSRIPPRKLGRKALAANLSDVASAGGTPRFALVSLGLPPDLEVELIDGLYEGLREEGTRHGVDVVGGNISRSRLGMFIDVFLLGEAPRDRVVLRSGARPGDRVLLTGRVGDAAAGVALLLDPALRAPEPYASEAVERQFAPTPRVREGALIGSLNAASAMIDVSDGIAGDLGHICERSGASARLRADCLPVAPENRALSRQVRGNEWHFALRGGEDYELLFTAPPARAAELARAITAETGTPVADIGEILPPDRPSELVLAGGEHVPLGGAGWDHFK